MSDARKEEMSVKDTVANSVIENANQHQSSQHLTENAIVFPISTSQSQNVNTTLSAECSSSSKQQGKLNTSQSHGFSSNIPTNTMIVHSKDGESVNKSSKISLSNDIHSKECNNEFDDTTCTPIILSVRGNATDVDCISVTGPSSVTEISSTSSVSRSSDFVDKTSKCAAIFSDKDKNNTATSVLGIFNGHSIFKQSAVPPDASSVASTLLNTMPSHTDMRLSTSHKDFASQVSTNITMSASSLLLSAASNVSGSTKILPGQASTQALKKSGVELKDATPMRNLLNSTFKKTTTSSVLRKAGNNGSGTPISSTVKIVLKGSENLMLANSKTHGLDTQPKILTPSSGQKQQSMNDNDYFDVDKLCKTIVNRIFENYQMIEKDGMTRKEVFQTTLLDPCKKQREHFDRHYICSVCGDEFYSEEYLNHHLDRKSFLLTYFCHECEENVTFYNKCKFWLHIRLERSECVDKEMLKAETSYFNLKHIMDPNEQEIDETPKGKFNCKFCHKNFLANEERISHIKATSSYLYTCSKCSLLLSNRCALLAHLDIHETVGKSHICPQCGDVIDHSDGLRVLFEHLDSCFHFNTCYVMSCECGELLRTTTAYKSHFLKAHTKLLYRCHLCGSCFTSIEFFEAHCPRSHGKSIVPDKVVLCAICKKGFPNHLKLKAHIESHSDKIVGMRKKILTCFLCQKYFGDPKSLCSHVEKQHTHRPKRCTICFGLFESRQNLVQHIVSKICSPNRLPKNLHICIDAPPHYRTAYVNANNYKKMFKVTERLLHPKETSITAPSSKASATNITVSAKPTPGLSSQKSIAGTASSQVSRTGVSATKLSQKAPSSQPCSNISSKTVPASCVPNASPTMLSSGTKSTVSMSANRAPTGDPVKINLSKKRFQCHSCKIFVVGKRLYDNHIRIHESLGVKVDSRDKLCSVCNKTVDAELIQSHLVDHQMQGHIICSLCQRSDFSSMSEATKHSRNMCYYRIVANNGASFVQKNKTLLPMANEQGETLLNENDSPSELQSLKTDPIHEKATVFPCLMCGLAFTCKQDKDDHVSRFHDGTRTLYFCLVCKRKGGQKYFTKKNMLSKHISRKHRIVNPSQIAKSIHTEEQNVFSGRVVPTEYVGQCNVNAPPPKRLRLADEGDFMCGKCGFSSEDSKIFEDHIVTHNPKKEPQCPECGLCFTVLVALKKHLFVVHKIKATDEYLKKREMLGSEEEINEDDDDDSNSQAVLMDSTSESEVEARKVKRTRASISSKMAHHFECTVCYRSLSSTAALQKHMRNHGMAFIRSKRLHKN